MTSILGARAGLGALLWIVVAACSGDDTATAGDGSASSTSAGSTTAGTDATTATTTATTTTAATGTASESTSAGTTAATTSTDGTGPVTDSDGTTVATTDATTGVTTDATTDATTSTTTEGTTGGSGEAECKDDKECELYSDCCVCKGIYPGEPVLECPKLCIIDTCTSLGVDSVTCRLDSCVAGRLHCDDSKVICDAPVPACDPGYLPEVNDNGTCYTQGCVPVNLCDFVPDCTYCAKDQMCVIDVTQLGQLHRCEPIPAACKGTPSCACAAAACDNGPYDQCALQGGDLHCSCPQC